MVCLLVFAMLNIGVFCLFFGIYNVKHCSIILFLVLPMLKH